MTFFGSVLHLSQPRPPQAEAKIYDEIPDAGLLTKVWCDTIYYSIPAHPGHGALPQGAQHTVQGI